MRFVQPISLSIVIRYQFGIRAAGQLLDGLGVEFQGRDGRDLAADDPLHVPVQAGRVLDDAPDLLFALLP
jgi:hypothetical protein